jgi:hypothetical protein
VLGAERRGQLSRQPDDAVLRGDVRAAAAAADEPCHRRHVDDAPRPARHHLGERALAGEERSRQVDRDDPLPEPGRHHVGVRVPVQHAGGVDDDAERPELAHRITDRAIDVVPAAHVGGNERRAPAGLGDLLHRLGPPIGEQVEDGDGSPALGEAARDRAPEPGAAPSHDRGAGEHALVGHARSSA